VNSGDVGQPSVKLLAILSISHALSPPRPSPWRARRASRWALGIVLSGGAMSVMLNALINAAGGRRAAAKLPSECP
jgi:hypothetical protein